MKTGCKFRNLRLSYLFLSIFVSNNVIANDGLFEMSLEQLLDLELSTASGFEQKLRKSPANLTVYYPWQWQAMGIERLDQLLETIPGIHVTQSQLALNLDVYAVRGLQSGFNNRINLLLDGHVIKGANGGSTSFGFKKSLAGIKRVEIIKGPGSVIYGADAFSGVINLITSDEQAKQDSVISLRAGGFDSYSLSIEANRDVGEGNIDVALSYMHNNDDNGRIITSDLQSIIDQIFLTSTSKAPGVINDRAEIIDLIVNYKSTDFSLTYWHWQSFDSGVGAGAAQVLDPQGKTTTVTQLLSFEKEIVDVLGGDLNWTLAWQHYDGQSQYNIFPAGTVLPIGSDGNVDFATPVGVTLFTEGYIGNPGSENNLWRTSLTHLAELNSHFTLRTELGFEALETTANETKNFGPGILDGTQTAVDGTLTDVTGSAYIYRINTNRDIAYFSLQTEWLMNDQWSLNLGARYDHYSDFGSTFNPRGGIIWTDSEQLTTKLIFSSAFRAPSDSDLYFKNNPSAIGNPDLQEEDINNTEFIIEWQPLEHWLVNLDLFQYKAKNLIEFVYDPQKNQNIAQNIGSQEGVGGELLVTAEISSELRWSVYYAWLSIDFADPMNPNDYPRKQSYISVNWQISDDWIMHGRYKRIADRKRAVGDLRGKLADYSIANLMFSYQGISDKTTLRFIVNNVFDEDGYEPSPAVIATDYPIHGRQFVLELVQKF